MPRIRSITPGFFVNDELCNCDPLARLLFIGLWCYADRAGRLEDRPKKIKVEVLPFDKCDVNSLLQQLHDTGFIFRYESEGAHYIAISSWEQYQNPHKNEIQSVIPPYSGNIMINREKSGLIMSAQDDNHSEVPAVKMMNAVPYNEIQELWNTICGGTYNKITGLGDSRKKHVKARWTEHPDLEYWRSVFNKLLRAEHCLGLSDGGWKADFDFIFKNNNGYTKLMEGGYDKAFKKGEPQKDVNERRGVSRPEEFVGGIRKL